MQHIAKTIGFIVGLIVLLAWSEIVGPQMHVVETVLGLGIAVALGAWAWYEARKWFVRRPPPAEKAKGL